MLRNLSSFGFLAMFPRYLRRVPQATLARSSPSVFFMSTRTVRRESIAETGLMGTPILVPEAFAFSAAFAASAAFSSSVSSSGSPSLRRRSLRSSSSWALTLAMARWASAFSASRAIRFLFSCCSSSALRAAAISRPMLMRAFSRAISACFSSSIRFSRAFLSMSSALALASSAESGCLLEPLGTSSGSSMSGSASCSTIHVMACSMLSVPVK
mmetsp:Transcript_34804/g.98672  ORF Transcript_34804/g.98672 Transcript_34804/m.98672 type:complete len:213 (+) Transcript_34804:447-1085(+)